jgi:putative zinc finger/helix-turn-helix YgiT family protein
MNACLQCGTAMKVRRENYSSDLFGVPVTLVGVRMYRCPNCGEFEVEIPNPEGLHAVIARHLIGKRARLTGREIRFLRKYLDYSSSDFASTIGVTPETISRWEKDKERIGPAADRLLRMFILYTKSGENYPIANFAKISSHISAPMQFGVKSANNEWREAAVPKRTG